MTDPGRVPATVTLKTGTGKAADGPLQSNVRDIEFNLFEVLDLEKALATGEFGDLDGEAVRQMLAEAARLAQGPLANSFADGDRHPPQFDPDTHAVRLSESFKTSVWAWQGGMAAAGPRRGTRQCARPCDGERGDQRVRPRRPNPRRSST